MSANRPPRPRPHESFNASLVRLDGGKYYHALTVPYVGFNASLVRLDVCLYD